MNGKILAHENYLEAIYLGERKHLEMSKFLADVQEETLRNNQKNILFDTSNAIGNYDDLERVKIAEDI